MKKYLITAGTLIGGATLLCAIALQINKYPLVEAYAGGGTPTCRACGDSNIKCLVANTADGTDNESPCSYQELYMTRKSCSTSRKGLEPKDNISFNMYSGVVSGPNQTCPILAYFRCVKTQESPAIYQWMSFSEEAYSNKECGEYATCEEGSLVQSNSPACGWTE